MVDFHGSILVVVHVFSTSLLPSKTQSHSHAQVYERQERMVWLCVQEEEMLMDLDEELVVPAPPIKFIQTPLLQERNLLSWD